jgi:hypothetical protein
MEQPSGLIAVLMDPTARLDERDDAAMDLANYDETEAEEALFYVATDPREDGLIQGSAGESLAEIWLRRGDETFPRLEELTAEARVEAVELIRARRGSEPPRTSAD